MKNTAIQCILQDNTDTILKAVQDRTQCNTGSKAVHNSYDFYSGMVLHISILCGFTDRVCVLDWPACSPDLSPTENVCRFMKRRIKELQPQTIEQLKSCIQHEWAKIPVTKLQQ